MKINTDDTLTLCNPLYKEAVAYRKRREVYRKMIERSEEISHKGLGNPVHPHTIAGGQVIFGGEGVGV